MPQRKNRPNIFKVAILTLLCFSLCNATTSAYSQTPADCNKTEVVIIGTIHKFHYESPKYKPEVLKEIILSLKPDAILNELPLSQVDPNGRPLFRDPKKHPEGWAADTVAMELGIRQIPFDRPDRQENFKKTNYFERQRKSSEQTQLWLEELQKKDPNSFDLKIAQVGIDASYAQADLFDAAPEVINSKAFDLLIKIKHSIWKGILPEILGKYPDYRTVAAEDRFFADQWNERNRIMADNIINATKQYSGKRLVVLTGAEHRYILRDLLKDEACIDLKEYWQVTSPEVEKPQKSNESNQPAYLKPIPQDKLKEDLDFLFKTIEEVHPNMYAYTSKEEFELLHDKLYRQITQPMTRLEFYKLTAPVVASLKNGHTQLYMPDKDFKEYLSNGGKILPLEFRWDRDRLILDKNYGKQNLSVGSTVLKIDGHNAERLITRFARYFPDEFKDNNPGWAAKDLIHCLWLEYGQTEHLDLYIQAVDGTEKAYKVKGIPFAEFQANKAEGDVDNRQPYSYRYMPEYNTGVIEMRVCRNDDQYKSFLENTFNKMKAENVPYLIIDIRNNMGGNSSAGDALLNYLTDQPFRQYEEWSIKASAQVMKIGYIREHLPEDVRIGSVVTNKGPFTKPKDTSNPLRFHGRKFVLIGPVTFSAANCFASATKCFNIATLIGEETGGKTANYGDIFAINLPHSGLSAGCSMKYFVEACGKPDGRGVLPDYEVKQKPQDSAKGVDTALEFTLNLIKNSETEE